MELESLRRCCVDAFTPLFTEQLRNGAEGGMSVR